MNAASTAPVLVSTTIGVAPLWWAGRVPLEPSHVDAGVEPLNDQDDVHVRREGLCNPGAASRTAGERGESRRNGLDPRLGPIEHDPVAGDAVLR